MIHEAFVEKYGKWAFITGASSGIGKEFAYQTAALGLNVVIAARDIERLEKIAKDIKDKHLVEVLPLQIDLSKDGYMASVIEKTKDLDVGLLVNNAGFGRFGEFLDADMSKEMKVLEVNYKAPMYLTHHFGNRMRSKEKGGIVFVSSVLGMISTPYAAHYSASKGHNLYMGEALWFELQDYNIDVLTLCPGRTSTEFFTRAGIGSGKKGMHVTEVVDIALGNLGRKMFVIPGAGNRLTFTFLKFLSRRMKTLIIGARFKKRKEKTVQK